MSRATDQNVFLLLSRHAKKMSVVLGAHNIYMTEASQQRIDVAKYFPHPCFDGNDNDIMLLKVSANFQDATLFLLLYGTVNIKMKIDV